jgi:phenylalanyl-tRNA synthetase beta chain
VKVNLSWLKRYIDITEDPTTLAHDLTMFGVNVEGVQALVPLFTGVVFGRVLDVKRHPKADRLTVCTVDVGGTRPLSIVCGAPNVRAGLAVPVALDGAVLAGGAKIKRSRIRGEVSEGMICSAVELGVGDDAAGIMELDFDEKPGASLEGRLGETEHVMDVEVTPNRPDLLSHLGIAREVAALYRRELHFPQRYPLESGEAFDLLVESGQDCPRYTAAFIDEVSVGASPPWMQKLLTSVGLRPINNIVDATNFVLMELGQPLHAFDRDTLEKDSIVVRRARKGESITTLDGVLRELDSGILVIADGERAVGIAGVMGGRNTEIHEATRRILIESAVFDPRLVRHARQRFKLDTEASYRFERGGDIGATFDAAARVCQLIAEMGAGRPLTRCADAVQDAKLLEPRSVSLRVKQANRVMGTELGADDIASLLERLALPTRVSGETLQAAVPTFRRDIAEEIDLIEETARVYGYENIGLDPGTRPGVFSAISHAERCGENVSQCLASRGLAEVVTSSFMDPGDPARMGWGPSDDRSRPMRIANPLTENQSMLRTSLLPGLLGVIGRNTAAECEAIRIFELGKVFMPIGDGAGLPREELRLAALFARNAGPLQWIEQERAADFFDMKGELEAILQYLGSSADIAVATIREGRGLGFRWLLNGSPIGEGGAISRETLAAFDVDPPVFFFDVHFDGLLALGTDWPRFHPISPYPAVKRDLCLVVKASVTFAEVRDVIVKHGKFLDSIRLFDYYRGGHLGEGKRSFTFRLNFRSSEGTLDGSTVDRELERILGGLQRELQATLRME